MQRSNQRDADEVTYQTIGVPLGLSGLDLREPVEPGSLTRLLNARFSDEKSIRQRNGHEGVLIRDDSGLAPLGSSYGVSGDWVFGHGATVSTDNASSWAGAHHPFPNRGAGTLRFNGADILWTGDRLLISAGDGEAARGSSPFWNRSTSTTPLARGIPAYLPLQTDGTPPDAISGSYVETALTTTLRAFAECSGTGDVTAWIVDRATNVVIDKSVVSETDSSPVEVRIINSNDTVVVIWRDYDSRVLYKNHWTGSAWSGEDVIRSDVYAFDVCPVPGGFYLLWREGNPTADALKIGAYTGTRTSGATFTFDTEVTTDTTPAGPVALDVAANGQVGVLYEGTGLHFRVFNESLTAVTAWAALDNNSSWAGGISLRARGLLKSSGEYGWVIHACRSAELGVKIAEATISAGVASFNSVTRFNSVLASKSWLAGDEVFCWLRSTCADTHYLVAGTVPQPQVCGYADREEATTRTTHDNNLAIPMVSADPLDERGLTFTWARPFDTGQDYSRAGNVRVGDIDLLPRTTFVQYGKSVYSSGSAVRNWDGVELGDAGFQDYPTVSSTSQGTDGSLEALGEYYFRVYAVRYNKRGERFQSPALTTSKVTLESGKDAATLTIKTLPSTNHEDIVYEVYRTEHLGTTFYLDGTVDNDLTAATVTYTSRGSDADLIDNLGDSHAPGIGQLAEIEEMGPVGCAILAVSGDRLWGIGGQVAPGLAQFSKLKEDGEGAGFDALGGFQSVDTEGGNLTSVHPLNDTTVIHQERRLFVVAGTGPDNYGRGAFSVPQIVLADGAITHFGCALIQLGAVYWGADGPRLLTTGFQVRNISAPVRPLAATLEPSGCRANLSGHEVMWYTEDGTALLWSYLGDNSRWAQWSGLHIAGCSDDVLCTTDGRLLYEDPDAVGDDGQTFAFVWAMARLRPEQVLGGFTLLRDVGVVGRFDGPHRLRFRIYYNGSPLWTDEWIWEPTTDTWLATADDYADLTPAEIDALTTVDRSGGYMTHKRVSRQNCQFFEVEVSNIEATGPTYTPHELTLELGARGGMGRVPVNTFTTTVGG
jgi:hypothetical protein